MQLAVEKPLIIITGPTAVGKTALSLNLVKELNGEIISADSRLFYRGMDIGTAKPTNEEQSTVPHHLIDIVDIDESMSLAIFLERSLNIMNSLWEDGRTPFLVGGTGQFVRAIIEGWVVPAQQNSGRLRDALTKWGHEIGAIELFDKLKIIDPDAALNIEPNNLRRTTRALEVMFLTGRKFSQQRRAQTRGFQYKIIGLNRDRQELFERVDRRIDAMFEMGFLKEVNDILDQGYSPDLPALSAIGYNEVIAYIDGDYDLEEAKRRMRKKTREYVRRQANWFKPTDPRIKWFDMQQDRQSEIREFILDPKGWNDA